MGGNRYSCDISVGAISVALMAKNGHNIAFLVTILAVATTVMLTLGIGRTRRLLTHVGRWCGAFFALSDYL